MFEKKGFTLIELLVVIAIIALLMAIIMPSFAKVKLIVKEVLCKNNIRQYGLATEMYTNENDEFYPNPWESLYSTWLFSGETQRSCRWHNAEYDLGLNAEKKDSTGKRYAGPYWPYLANTKANVCPTFASYKVHGDLHKNHDTSIPVEGPYFSYAMNGNLNKKGAYGEGGAIPVRKSRINNPTGTFLWAEENMWLLKFEGGTAISTEILNDNALLINDPDTGYGTDSFGTFHGVSSAEIEAELPTSSGGYGVYQKKGFTHALMLDGSIEQVRPEDNVRYCGDTDGY